MGMCADLLFLLECFGLAAAHSFQLGFQLGFGEEKNVDRSGALLLVYGSRATAFLPVG